MVSIFINHFQLSKNRTFPSNIAQYNSLGPISSETGEGTKKMATLFGSSSDDYGHCCPPVFDPYTLVALLGGIALATFFLRLVIITDPNLPPKRRRRNIEYGKSI